jgi:uncharacterized protein YjbI with pentapeptide repeats
VEELGIGSSHREGTSLHAALARTLEPEVAATARTVAKAVRLDGAETAGCDMTGALTDKARGKSPSSLGQPLEELVALHELWVSSDGSAGQRLDLSGCDLRGATNLEHATLTGIRARGAILVGLRLDGIALQVAQLDEADLRGSHLTRADLRGINLMAAKLDCAEMRNCNLDPLALPHDRLLVSRLQDARLRHADLRGSTLRRASLARADLSGADARGVQCDGVDWSEAILDGCQW